ncbi:alpha/beta fold hydrolase [Sphaerisporangium rubeum]|uniref:Surfactin synthase thioesterase subunit n=1 Tax=Sphaerisporangium rubeum TaxID=321317 RepID=A0A7X0I9H2_9ACTN|nr:thioesterase domain-containing protein [Sphaerisporangium rubeum]MBB6470933.1 surfactin synthase thioesterase subunit [Sphaerisporangium rubeum]
MNAHPQDIDRRWLKRFGRADDTARIRLLCFHHAGGSASMYRSWRQMLPRSVELVAVQLPGRADRFTEPAHDRMTGLVGDLVDVLKPLFDRPFAFYGISMGARVAWALTHALRDLAMPMPTRLYIACDPAPCTDDGTWPWQNRPDGLVGYLREMGGTPPEVLDQPDLLRAVLPMFEADLSVLSTHDFHPLTPLDVPIRAFAGVDDPVGTPDKVVSWRTETTAGFRIHHLAGGHFLNPAAERQVVETIVQDLI